MQHQNGQQTRGQQGNGRLRWLVPVLALALTGAVWAKLPPPSDEQKAKAAETKAKADEATKKGNEELAASQDKVAARYYADMKAKGKEVKPPTPVAVPAVAPATPAAPAAAAAPPPAAK